MENLKPRLVKKNAQAEVRPAMQISQFVSRVPRVALVGINSCEPLAPLGIRPGFVAIHEKGKGRVNSVAGTQPRHRGHRDRR